MSLKYFYEEKMSVARTDVQIINDNASTFVSEALGEWHRDRGERTSARRSSLREYAATEGQFLQPHYREGRTGNCSRFLLLLVLCLNSRLCVFSFLISLNDFYRASRTQTTRGPS